MAVREGRGAKRERGRDGGLERGRRQGDILTGGYSLEREETKGCEDGRVGRKGRELIAN